MTVAKKCWWIGTSEDPRWRCHCDFYGCSVPVILRPGFLSTERTCDPEWYEFIGEAYIYDKMDGEAMYDEHIEKVFKLV